MCPVFRELQELWTYLEIFLGRSSWASVSEYLRSFKFSSTLLTQWSECENKLMGSFQAVLHDRSSIDMLASLTYQQRASAHEVAENLGLKHSLHDIAGFFVNHFQARMFFFG